MSSAGDEGLRLDQQLCFALYAATRAVTQAYQPFLGPLNLTYPQYLVMLVLWEKDGLTVKAIGERLYLDSGTLTPLLKRLETNGLVSRCRAKEDERQVIVRLTDAGADLRAQAAEMRQAMQCRFSGALEQAAGLRDILRGLVAFMHQQELGPKSGR